MDAGRLKVPVFKVAVCLAEMVFRTLLLEKLPYLYFSKDSSGSPVILTVEKVHGVVPFHLRNMGRLRITGNEGLHRCLITRHDGTDLAQHRPSLRI